MFNMYSILVLISLVHFIDVSSGVTLRTPLETTTSSRSNPLLSEKTSEVNIARTDVISVPVDDEGTTEQCRCTLFYLCDGKDEVNLTSTKYQDHCDAASVCCKVKPGEPDPTPKPSYSTEPSTPIESTILYPGTEEECRCTIFYMCNSDDVVNLTSTKFQNHCGDINVCCKVKAEERDTSSKPLNPTEPSILINPYYCRCVPFYLCADFDPQDVNKGEEPLLYLRGPMCSAPDVCCPPQNVLMA